MANLGETTEFHDSPEELANNVDQLADLVKRSRKMVFHTGAGISTRFVRHCGNLHLVPSIRFFPAM